MRHYQRLSAFKPRALVNDIHAKATLIRTGDYIGFLPKLFAQRWVETKELRSIHPAKLKWNADYYVIAKSGSIWSPIARTFLEDVRHTLPKRAEG